MFAPVPASFLAEMVDPVPVPELSPTLYAVLLVHVTVRDDVAESGDDKTP